MSDHKNYTVYIERDENGMFIGSIPSIPACYSQGKTQEELMSNLREVLDLCLKNQEEKVAPSYFVGIQNIQYA